MYPQNDEDLPDALKVEISTNGDVQNENSIGKSRVETYSNCYKVQ